ncbi:MAG TPA: hypothetical protein VM598_04910 [Bdellovibrionota bacterium]|nr:hypothetical protein [Bdellovibrionota bacterium]
MSDRFAPGIALLKRFQNFMVLLVLRKFLIPVALFMTYFLAFGVMSIFLRIFGRRYLSAAPRTAPGSYWVEARGYEPDRLQLEQQS